MSNAAKYWRSTFLYGSVAVSASAIGIALAFSYAGSPVRPTISETGSGTVLADASASESSGNSRATTVPKEVSVARVGLDVVETAALETWREIRSRARVRTAVRSVDHGGVAPVETEVLGPSKFGTEGHDSDSSLDYLPIETGWDVAGVDDRGAATNASDMSDAAQVLAMVQRPRHRPEGRLYHEPMTLNAGSQEDQVGDTAPIELNPDGRAVVADHPATDAPTSDLAQIRQLAELQHRQLVAQRRLLGETDKREAVVLSSNTSELKYLVDEQFRLINAQDQQLRVQSRPTTDLAMLDDVSPTAPDSDVEMGLDESLPMANRPGVPRDATEAGLFPSHLAEYDTAPSGSLSAEEVLPLPVSLPEQDHAARLAFDEAGPDTSFSAMPEPELDVPAQIATRLPVILHRGAPGAQTLPAKADPEPNLLAEANVPAPVEEHVASPLMMPFTDRPSKTADAEEASQWAGPGVTAPTGQPRDFANNIADAREIGGSGVLAAANNPLVREERDRAPANLLAAADITPVVDAEASVVSDVVGSSSPSRFAGETELAANEPSSSDSGTAQELNELRELIRRQSEQLDRQERQLDEQRRNVEAQRDRLEQLEQQVQSQPTVVAAPAAPSLQRAGLFVMPERLVVPNGESYTLVQGEDAPATSIEDPDAGRSDDVAGVYEVGGVLSRPGQLILEPSIEYSQSNINRFFFQGLEIVETVLVGNIEATDSDRDTYVAAGTARLGITNRAEVEVRVPGLYRNDRITRQIIGPNSTVTREIDGKGLGDIEASGRLQLNDGLDDWPVFVANARFKSATGEGPFDVSRDASGVEQELPTGSGFYGVEGGLSAIHVSDPVVFFGNAKYFAHLGRDVDKMIGTGFIGHVDPGDVFGLSFGMGFGVNEQASFSLSYEHNFVFETTSEINGFEIESESLDVGSLGLGFNYALNEMTSINLSVTAGVTDDAPDVRMLLRVPVRFNLY